MPRQYSDLQLPVYPNLKQLRHQAKDLLHAIQQEDAAAIAQLRKHHPKTIEPAAAKLADAQFVLARCYGLSNWGRLVSACRMTDAIWNGDAATVHDLIVKHPALLHESARGIADDWGPPMSYAANVGQNGIIEMLEQMGAADLQHAFDRACLQGRIDTARRLYAMGARPIRGCVMGPCETLHDTGLQLLFELGAEFSDDKGDRLAPFALILQTYCRYPKGKHGCIELAAKHGTEIPDTPTMAVHRGRIDLLEKHVKNDPQTVHRTFSHEEIYPPVLGCDADHSLALHGTPVAGGTLLHLCVEFDEIEIAQWLIEHGADANAKADVDADGFAGHTPLFGCVVSQSYLCGRQRDAAFARLLLDHGADPNARASLRKQLRGVPDESVYEYYDVTPLSWGQQFHGEQFHGWVSKPAMQLIAERGGKR